MTKPKWQISLKPAVEFVDTSDGWQLATYRYCPSVLRRQHPVLLIHGFGTNRFDTDFPETRLSLAKYLYHQGYDTWVIELRGTGLSRRKSLLGRITSCLQSGWNFDDLIYKDFPSVVSHIQEKTKKKSSIGLGIAWEEHWSMRLWRPLETAFVPVV